MANGAGTAAVCIQEDVTVLAQDRLVVALDVPTTDEAWKIVEQLDGTISIFKIGPWLQFAVGYENLIDNLISSEKQVFLDTKGCDIPETMRGCISGAAKRKISFLTVHGNGEVNDEAMIAAVNGRINSSPKIFMVTLLTSLDRSDLLETGYTASVEDIVLYRTERAVRCGCNGVIASGLEARKIREVVDSQDFLIVSPGIRTKGADVNDHKRAVTPTEAISAGADYLVVGRPIIKAQNRKNAADSILDEMQRAFDSIQEY